jgi:hypothetical protein
VLDQWKEHKISDPTVAEKFNTCRFADHKESVIALLARVCAVSVETMKIVRAMPGIGYILNMDCPTNASLHCAYVCRPGEPAD